MAGVRGGVAAIGVTLCLASVGRARAVTAGCRGVGLVVAVGSHGVGGDAAAGAVRAEDVGPRGRDHVEEGGGLAHDVGAEARLDVTDPIEQVFIDAVMGLGVGRRAGTADLENGVAGTVEDVLLLG